MNGVRAKVLKIMNFIKNDKPEVAANFLYKQIQSRLDEGQPVVWFVSGGSAIAVAVLTAKKFSDHLSSLTVTLADERYGPVGHPNSNWQLLLEAGFNISSARLQPVLNGQDAARTAADYELSISSLFNTPGYKIALLGIGADGHTAGILPNLPSVDSTKLINYYHTPQFDRLTLTPQALAQLDEAVVYARGTDKHMALGNLDKNMSIEHQPAQILKQIPRLTIFNDLKGDDDEDNN
jgi:6-phosphogluconolactonase/glucosamine-6-phosphate isomerase/deaminase